MSDLEEDAGALGRQKSIFSGMGRVRQINQFREKWNTSKTKMHPPGAGFGDAAASSAWVRRGGPKKYSATLRSEGERDKGPADAHSSDRPRLHRALTASDLERYRSIALWLSGNGIDIVDAPQAQATAAVRAGGVDVFDDVLDSLDALEKSVESELALMSGGANNQSTTTGEVDPAALQSECDAATDPPICDYVVVVGPDIADIAAKNYWNRQENVFEAMVAFAYPPHCQFNAESIEHFCFPRGIKAVLGSEGVNPLDEPAEFFVLLLSGGGAQGQSVQYAFCMKGLTRVPSSFDSAHFSLVPICYCIVSQLPLVAFFRDVLRRLLDDMQGETSAPSPVLKCNVVSNEHSHYVDGVFRKLRSVRISEKGSAIAVDIFPAPEQPLVLQRPSIDDGKDTLLLQWSLPLLLASLTIDQTLQILALLLTEMKVIVVCDQLSLLSSATLGLASMLQPLSWAGPLITILPPFLHEYMEASVPLICGIDTLPPGFECTAGSGIVNLLDHRIVLHPDDEHNSGALKIPGADALFRDLDFFTSPIRQPKSERVVPFGVDVVIRRVRLHVQQLLDACTELEGTAEGSTDSSLGFTVGELKFMRSIMQTQMYQKYRDDHPLTAVSSADLKSMGESDKEGGGIADSARMSTEREADKTAFNAAVDVIFRIALKGVNEIGGGPEDPLEPTDAYDYDTSFGNYCQLDSDSASSGTEFPTETSPAGDSDKGQQIEELSNSQPPHPQLEVTDASSTPRSGCNWLEPAAPVRDAAALNALGPNIGEFASGRQSESHPFIPDHVDSEVTLADIEAEINLCRADFDFHPLRREDTETTMSLLGTTFSEMMLRGGGSCSDADWFSESSEDENFHDCQDSDNSEPIETDASATRHGSRADNSIMQTTASCVKIQRTWRDWIARRRRPARRSPPQAESQHGSALVYDDANAHLLHRRMEILHELGVLTRGVTVQQEDATRHASEGRLRVSADVLRLEWWRASEISSDERVDTVRLQLIRRISSRVSALDADGAHSSAGWLVAEVHYDGGMWRFRHDMLAQDFFCFLRWITVSTLSPDGSDSSVSLTSSSRSLPASISSNSESPADMATRGMSIESTSLSSSHDRECLDKFKAALRAGFLVEKHGRSGKPHAKMLYTDAACTQIVWKKPPASRATDSATAIAKNAPFFQKSVSVGLIKAVLCGKQTIVFNRSTARGADEKLCLSIVGATRTLDIRAYSKEDHELLFCGFTLLVKANGTPRL